MRRVLRCLCGGVLLFGGVGSAHAGGASPPATPAAGGNVYVVRGAVAQYIRPAGSSVGSISIRVAHASRGQGALRGMLVTFGIDTSTHIVGAVRVDGTCSVRVRAKSTDDVPNSTALQVVADERGGVQDKPKKSNGNKADAPAKAQKPPAGSDKPKPTPEPTDKPTHTTPATPSPHASDPKSDGKGHK